MVTKFVANTGCAPTLFTEQEKKGGGGVFWKL